MDYIQVELKKTKFMSYLFDGKEESAKEFCRKWGCNYVADFMDKELVSIVFPDGKKCYAGNYVVIDGKNFTQYTPAEFIKIFNVVSNNRQFGYTFMSED
jgi:hypothetical protein